MAKNLILRGFKLFQPWANEVVKGRLNFLVRSFPTKIRGRVAVIATIGMDGFWLKKASEKEIKEVENRIGAIGSVEIKDCIEVKPDKIKERLIQLAGKKYWDYYPKYLIPEKTRTGKVYIWVLENAKEWKKPRPVESRGIVWARVKFYE